MAPDLDNYAVAIATLTGGSTETMHRTFSHSIFTVAAVWLLFQVVGRIRAEPRLQTFGGGLAIGIGMHMLADMLIWFNGVHLLWPWGPEFNLWANYSASPIMKVLVDLPAEPLFFALFFGWLAGLVRTQTEQSQSAQGLTRWSIAMWAAFAVTLPLAFMDIPGFFTIYGAGYLAALTAACLAVWQFRTELDRSIGQSTKVDLVPGPK
jgi:membrane-bound metal-dependent hydrolase YbcI (DUF457 family)